MSGMKSHKFFFFVLGAISESSHVRPCAAEVWGAAMLLPSRKPPFQESASGDNLEDPGLHLLHLLLHLPTILLFSWLITINCCSSLSVSSCLSFLFSLHLLEASLLRSRILRNFWADASSSVSLAAAPVAKGWGVIGRNPVGKAGLPLFLDPVSFGGW